MTCQSALDAAAADEISVRHAGPVTQRSLRQLATEDGLEITWAQYRLHVLTRLQERGVTGIGELMHSTLKTLMPAPASSGRTGATERSTMPMR